MRVMKFGGTSVGSAPALENVGRILCHAWQERPDVVAVVSAVRGATDALLEGTRRAASGHNDSRQVREQLWELHRPLVGVLPSGTRQAVMNRLQGLLGEVEVLLQSVATLEETTPGALDRMASYGERCSVLCLAALLRALGQPAQEVDAAQVIRTDDQHGEADWLPETRQLARAQLLSLLEGGVLPVVTGFIGGTVNGRVTTLGRGGSDYSATILAAALDAEEVTIWTDVDGILTADPRIVPGARSLPQISYTEAAELSYFGARVLHPRALLPTAERAIPVRIRNTFRPEAPGTVILPQVPASPSGVRAVTAIRALSLITVEGRGMLGVPGTAARVFSTVAQERINVLMISQSSSEQSICFAIPAAAEGRALQALEKAFALELHQRSIDRIHAQGSIVVVAVVGSGMRGTPGIAGKTFGALGRAAINVMSVAQGSSEYNLSLVVRDEDADAAVRLIHDEFELHQVA